MNATPLLALVLLATIPTFAQPQPAPAPAPLPQLPPLLPIPPRPIRGVGEAAPAPAPEKDFSNYLVTVNWSDAKAGTNFLQVLTAQGSFTLDAVQTSVRIGNNDVPTTVSFNGSLTEINDRKVKVTLFLGRTIPYVTSAYGGPAGQNQTSYQQLRVGFNSTLSVTLGKPVVIQSDQSGEVTLSVKRQEN